MRASIQHVDTARRRPEVRRLHAVEHGHQRGRAIGHGAINNLAFARALRFKQRGANAHGEVERPATEISHQIQRRHGCILAADGGQRAGQGNVINVMAGSMGKRPGLSPACHAPINEL